MISKDNRIIIGCGSTKSPPGTKTTTTTFFGSYYYSYYLLVTTMISLLFLLYPSHVLSHTHNNNVVNNNNDSDNKERNVIQKILLHHNNDLQHSSCTKNSNNNTCTAATTTSTTTATTTTNNNNIHDIFEEILQAPIPFVNLEEETESQRLVEALTDAQSTVAARTSYAYWYLEGMDGSNNNMKKKRNMAAMREARRHLVAESGNFESALQRLQEACHYRMKHQMELVRTCFNSDASTSREAELQAQIERDFYRQAVVMRGFGGVGVVGDESTELVQQQQQPTQQQPVLIKFPRHEGGVTEDEYIQSQLYIAERAVACTEFASRGRQEKILVVMDGGSSHSSKQHAPSVSWQLAAIRRVQHLYPERLGRLIIVDAPFWMRGIYHTMRPFLPPTTRNKIQMVSSSSSSSSSKSVSLGRK